MSLWQEVKTTSALARKTTPHHARVLKWPENSPDLNPIERLWRLIKQKVSTLNPTTLDELNRTIKDIWCKGIDQNVCKNLTDSTPLAVFRKLLKTKVTTPILVQLLYNLNHIGTAWIAWCLFQVLLRSITKKHKNVSFLRFFGLRKKLFKPFSSTVNYIIL